jgi:hypothetical protein
MLAVKEAVKAVIRAHIFLVFGDSLKLTFLQPTECHRRLPATDKD